MLWDYLELTKPRITVLILICAAVGYRFGCGSSLHLWTLIHTLVGTALLASGTSALNQWYEVDSDAKMRRTCMRPLPAGRMKRSHGFVFGVLLSAAGFQELWHGANLLTAGLGLFTLLSYLFLYTPLKQQSSVCSIVGAIPGAMPPVIWLRSRGLWNRRRRAGAVSGSFRVAVSLISTRSRGCIGKTTLAAESGCFR